MKRFITLISIALTFSIVAQAHNPYHYRDYSPVWHSTELFNSHDMMHSLLYGAFGVKYDYVQMDNVQLNTYGAYLEYCNIMASFTYGQDERYKAYDATASFLIPMHPNFRFGPRLDYMAMGDRHGNSPNDLTSGYNKSKFTVGLTLDLHLKSVSLTANISANSIGLGFGWAFGNL